MSQAPWRDLGIRAASAAVLAPLAVAAIWAGGVIWLACLTAIAAGLWMEWVLLWRRREPRPPGHGAAWVLPAGLAYIAAAYASLLLLHIGWAGFVNVLFVMLVVWAGDVGAYLAGRLVGGPRLAPHISPGKTWSGAAGGTLCAMLAGVAVAMFSAGGHPLRAAGVALLLSVMAQAGDLLESAAKRWFGAKDSGRLIPGHGGLLDRLDGVLAAAPAALACSLLAGPGALWG